MNRDRSSGIQLTLVPDFISTNQSVNDINNVNRTLISVVVSTVGSLV
jgi:hypothetical protein